MPNVKSVFDAFPNIEDISINNVAVSMGKTIGIQLLENQIGNKILYPQTVPVTAKELTLELAILKEAIRLAPDSYYNPNLKKIFIPEQFLVSFPSPVLLAGVFIDVFLPRDITYICIKSDKGLIGCLGSVIRPELVTKGGVINFNVLGKSYKLKIGGSYHLPINQSRADIKFESPNAKLLGEHDLSTEVFGGEVGIIVDTRV